jgi:YHS domain-containing protein
MKKKPQFLENGKALKGYDPLSVYDGKAILGNEGITSTYDDGLYHFISFESKMAFDKTPEKYAPKYGGYCSIAVSEGSLVEANPHSALVQNGDLHVFYKDEVEDTQDEWKENPSENKKRAEIEWVKLV